MPQPAPSAEPEASGSGFGSFLKWVGIILGCLVLEHWLARRRSLKWINTAFFKLNAVVSTVFLLVTLAEVVFPNFRVMK